MKSSTDNRYRNRLTLNPGAVFILTALSLVALSLLWEPIHWSWCAWIALVPWTVAMVAAKRWRQAVVITTVAGLIYYLINLAWLRHVTPAGYAALCFYLAWYFPLTGWVLRRVYQARRWPLTFVLPLAWVAQEYLRATIMTGFPWLFLSHTLHDSTRFIQTCDLGGSYTLTFLIAMVNGMFCDLLLRPIRLPAHAPKQLAASTLIFTTITALLAGWAYGFYRVKQGQKTITPADTITVVQGSIPQHVKGTTVTREDIFDTHLRLSQDALKDPTRPSLIVWSETVCNAINDEFINLPISDSAFDYIKDCRLQHRRLQNFTRQNNINLLTGASARTMKLQNGLWETDKKWNSAILYQSNGRTFPQRYDKMHLVPFGEVVPFKYSAPWLYNLLNSLTPYDYEYSLDAGTNETIFNYPASNGDTLNFAVAICYEDVMPAVPRRLAYHQGKKRIDFLLNISNDGWFVKEDKNGDIHSTPELLQHLVIAKFRAVENRLGIARSVNTGISAFIRPDGKVQHGKKAGTLSDNPRLRQATQGYLTDTIMIDSRTSPYSVIGDRPAQACLVLIILIGLVNRPKKKKSTRNR